MTTSAKILASALAHDHGLTPDRTEASHLRDFYTTLKRVYRPADIARVDSLLEAIDPVVDPDDSLFSAVIVETRRHRALEQVVLRTLLTLGIPVQLFHGRNNLNFIRKSAIAGFVERGDVTLTQLETGALAVREYNQLLLTLRFWERMRGRNKILVFQTDSTVCPGSPYTLKDFNEFDYIGSCWRPNRPSGLNIEGGSGGFSLRDWQRTVQVLQDFPPEAWTAGEDGYFAFHFELVGGRVATFDETTRFSSQCAFRAPSLGAHRVSAMSKPDRKRFFEYCPESADIFPCLAEFRTGNS